MRRATAMMMAAITALLLAPSPAGAGESISSGNWSGSALDAGPTSTALSTYVLAGTFRHQPTDRDIAITVSASPARSGACAIAPKALPSASTPRTFSATLSIPCNGTYTLSAVATTTQNNAVFPLESATLDRQVAVTAPAPKVTGVEALAEGRTVTISWDDMSPGVADLSGYSVERAIDDGDFVELDGAIDAATQTYEDTDLPAAGGDATYRVFSRRPSAGAGTIRSAASNGSTTTFEATKSTTTTGGDGGGADGTGTGSGGGTGGSGGGSTGGTATTVRPVPPRVFSGSFLPPTLRPATQTITTSTTVDPGYKDVLPYGARTDKKQTPLAGESLSSITTSSQPRRGMAVPVATALVLAIWAFHLRHLARAARPLP